MSMFVDHLMEALCQPAGRQSRPGEDLVVDTARYRALLMSELRRQQEADRLQGGVPAQRGESLALYVRDGSLDAHLYSVADGLIEMGVVREQALLDSFLHAATLGRLGVHNCLSPTDQLLLDLASRPGAEELDARQWARRYAIQIGLLSTPQVSSPPARTELGDSVRRLPCELVLPFLVTLERLSCYGPSDPWRAPAEAYQLLLERGEALVFARRDRQADVDPQSLWRVGRLRRWMRMGLCDPVPEALWPAGCLSMVQLNGAGHRALSEALQRPLSDVARLCEQLFRYSRKQALQQLLPPAEPSLPRRPATASADVIRLDSLDEALDPAPRPQKAPPPLPLEAESVDVEELCRGTLRDLQANPLYSHVSLSLVVPPGTARERLAMPYGRRALRMLLAELLTAAASAVARLPLPRILVELLASEDELSILLHDNGPGIPVSQRPRVFADVAPAGDPAPRYQLGSVRRTVEEALRGRIEIAAPRLGGASFRLTLPRPAQQRAA